MSETFWRRLVKQLDNQKPQRVQDLRRAYEERIASAWRNPPLLLSSLEMLLMSDDYPVRKIAALMRVLSAPRAPGKPGGEHTRWQRPHYLVAWQVERLVESRRARGTIERRDELISDVIRDVNEWHFMRKKTPLNPAPDNRDHNRVKELLRGPKRRRI